MPLVLNPPPPTPVEPQREVLHGVPITDPYRWLEDQNSPRTRKWLEQQTAYARAYLDAVPGRERIRKRVEELLAVETLSEPWKVGSRYFYLKRTANQQQPVIMMREWKNGKEIALIDPTDRDPTGTTAVGILDISRDATLLAYSVRKGGEDSCSVELLDVQARETLEDRLPRGFFGGMVFAADGKGLYYSHQPVEAPHPFLHAVYWHRFGTGHHQDLMVFSGGKDTKLRLILLGSLNGRRLGYFKLFSGDPQRIDFLVQDLAAGIPPRLVVEQIGGIFVPFLLDDGLIALTDRSAPNCRVVQIDIEHPDPEDWREIIPERHFRIQNLAVVGESIFLSYVQDLTTRVEVFDLDGHLRGELPLPCSSTVTLFPCKSNTDTLFYRSTSFSRPPSIFAYRPSTFERKSWARSRVPFDPSTIEVEQVHYPSKDGTLVPVFLVSEKGRRSAGPLPTFLTGYGGFGKCVTPQFTAYATYLIERGCLVAVANLRGGAEFGEAWHDDAKRQKRQAAIDDFIAAAEWLVAERHSAPARLAIGGGSNAGLLVGAALTQRPDLFRAVICLGPLLDMLRYHLFDFAEGWIDEYGSAENERDFQALLCYSPYHWVEDGAAYPAVMLISGDADTRCNPMHARKMTARLQAATTSRNPILLDYRPTWGHAPVQPLTARIEALTDRLAFTCQELGVNV